MLQEVLSTTLSDKSRTAKNAEGPQRAHEGPMRLWGWRRSHKLWGKALQDRGIVLVFFPVPPSLRQAAGPLTEDLPNVFMAGPYRADFAGNPGVRGVDLTLEIPSPRGTERRLLLRVDSPYLDVRKGHDVSCPWRKN